MKSILTFLFVGLILSVTGLSGSPGIKADFKPEIVLTQGQDAFSYDVDMTSQEVIFSQVIVNDPASFMFCVVLFKAEPVYVNRFETLFKEADSVFNCYFIDNTSDTERSWGRDIDKRCVNPDSNKSNLNLIEADLYGDCKKILLFPLCDCKWNKAYLFDCKPRARINHKRDS